MVMVRLLNNLTMSTPTCVPEGLNGGDSAPLDSQDAAFVRWGKMVIAFRIMEKITKNARNTWHAMFNNKLISMLLFLQGSVWLLY